ncbi:BrnT family toxin [Meiothermus granaticius]|uniref:Ribonuclease toxin, BrnT, of type II toxin-antitoxin system n=1 Tax=Meiothermus granaticius NBRC 107808 TaxID=1227551 RepID=A0A399F4H3_9DEIN|nr:BrnT family toxin [Meiothermus granaticius]RIH90685.1 Ribonuclease toxin, BrnT, of type II toxin-antitoxin system [Meiothermus granaticius NBRC 107808]GEM88467.1 hypothetical protein MGR01S_30920 [Meiothermus granaticius NBRC 107808]
MPAAKPKRKSGWLWNQPLPEFDWDDPEDERGNYVHATRHGVSADEIEEAFSYDLQRSLPSKNPRNREERAVLFSRTTDNAPVVVVYTMRNGQIRPISAHWASASESKLMRKWER